ncbi:hypothetical protein F511_00953 [Dorcoceras hygrometricum]|uniref:DUF241 domain protein n=1 Tax=Dorcoceras hygrometricum TaxID=472368 RepID=A0A2Z7AEN1_9LAMI|nr:hypothetical protein F511_00953 [Dorcoceras hygrometricum]
MSTFHSRSNSLPSKSHPLLDEIQDHLCQLRGSEVTSAKSIRSNLACLVNLHEGIKNLIQVPSIQQAISHYQCGNWIDEILEGSLRLLDLCGFSRDVVCLIKESVQNLESCIRRNRVETSAAEDINSYVASRKKINQMVRKKFKNMKSLNQNLTPFLEKAEDLKAIVTMLKEMEAISSSVLKSALILVSAEKRTSKQRSWLLLSKFTQTSHVSHEMEQEIDGGNMLYAWNVNVLQKGMGRTTKQNVLWKLKSCEMTIQDLEEGLESFFRSLVKTRVSLLML